MKGGGKRKGTSEAPSDGVGVDVDVAVDVGVGVDGAVVADGGDLNGGDGGGVQVENFEGTQLREGENEEPHVEESEEEGEDDGENEADDEEEENDEENGGVLALAQGGIQGGPILGENFYEVEAIRRKRVRKGQLQYFIKWHGWPETANTWEPPENLEAVPDVIAAFEESLKSGRHRKRKRKHVVHHIQPKKRLERSTTPYSLRRFSASTPAESRTQSAPLNDPVLADVPAFPQTVLFADEVGNGGDGSSLGKATHGNANRSANGSDQYLERNEENDYDPKLSELKATTANGNDSDKLAIRIQDAKISPASNGQMDGKSKVVCPETVESGRCRGAKRRKSGSVKRFTKESYAGELADTQNPADIPVGTVEQARTRNADSGGNNNHSRPASDIVRIVKPMGYSASVSGGVQDVLVTFVASRSDGTEVMVDNKYLKAYYPLLLINFYEQHLRYTPLS